MELSQKLVSSEETRRRVEEHLRSRSRSRAADDDAITQVIFYDGLTLTFARTWQQGAADDRWAFEVTSDGPRFIYYVCMRLQQMGTPAAHVLITTRGAPAAFWVAPDGEPPYGSGVVGTASGNTMPTDFGVTLASFVASAATLTVLSDGVAAGDGGSDLLRPLSLTLGGYAVASDQAVSRRHDGTAETAGNIDAASPPNGTVTTERQGGAPQTFPLDPLPWSA